MQVLCVHVQCFAACLTVVQPTAYCLTLGAKLDLIRTEVAAIPSASLWLLPYGLPPG